MMKSCSLQKYLMHWPILRELIFIALSCSATESARMCNKDVVAAFPYSQATISQHIKKLVDSDLIQVKKVDRFSYYYVNMGALARYLSAAKKFGQGQI